MFKHSLKGVCFSSQTPTQTHAACIKPVGVITKRSPQHTLHRAVPTNKLKGSQVGCVGWRGTTWRGGEVCCQDDHAAATVTQVVRPIASDSTSLIDKSFPPLTLVAAADDKLHWYCSRYYIISPQSATRTENTCVSVFKVALKGNQNCSI